MENIDLLAQSMTQTYFLMQPKEKIVKLSEDLNLYIMKYNQVYEACKSTILENNRKRRAKVMRPFGEENDSLNSTIIK